MKLILKILLAFLLTTNCFAQETGNEFENKTIQIHRAAEEGLTHFLGKIPKAMEARYGFSGRDEFKLAKQGKPIQMCNYFSEINPINEWRVPIVVNNEYRAFLTVAVVKNSYKAVDFGAAELAKEIGSYSEELNKELLSFVKLVRVHDLKCDFLMFPNDVKPLSSARELFIDDMTENGINKTKMHERIKILRQELNNEPEGLE